MPGCGLHGIRLLSHGLRGVVPAQRSRPLRVNSTYAVPDDRGPPQVLSRPRLQGRVVPASMTPPEEPVHQATLDGRSGSFSGGLRIGIKISGGAPVAIDASL